MGLFSVDSFPENIVVQKDNLQFVGKSKFNVFFVNAYEIAFYATNKPKNEISIFDKKLTKVMRLKLTTSLVTTDIFVRFMLDMFRKSAGEAFITHKPLMDELLAGIKRVGAKNGDIFDILYQSNGTIMLLKNDKIVEQAENESDFGNLSFGIWLGKNPINHKMKSDLLKGM